MSRERAKAVYETESADAVERFRAAGWEVIEELTAPPSAGGVAFVLGWLRDGEPVYPDEGRA